MAILYYFINNWGIIFQKTTEHLLIIFLSIIFAVLGGIPIGIFIYTKERFSRIVINTASVIFTIPSLALFGILVVALAPFKAGIGKVPAVIAITLYSLLPIIRNTYISLKQVDRGVVQAATGMGFTRFQMIRKFLFPISLPLIMSGIRSAVVVSVGVTTIAYLIGAGGLGTLIFEGIARTNKTMTITGVIIVALLGVLLNYLLILIEEIITPVGIRKSYDKL